MEASRNDEPKEEANSPGRGTQTSSQKKQGEAGHRPQHSLNAQSIINSFSTLGVICGVVRPTKIQSDVEVMRKADIVILDWLLQDRMPNYTQRLLRNLVAGENGQNSLRLVAIYTGEARLEDIYDKVVVELKRAGVDPKENENKTEISYQHSRVVIYAKSNVNLASYLKSRSIAEDTLPNRLIKDFSAMTEGLLPSIALTSLTAVREGSHKILDQFCADLDPAFLAQRIRLSNPEDAERQIVNHVAEELRGLMDNAVAKESPAGKNAVENWIRHKGGNNGTFMFGSKMLDLEETIELAKKGIENTEILKNTFFKGLSSGFSCNGDTDLDERLAWIMSFQTVFNAPPPILWLGSIIETIDDESQHLLCMRPRCDCVRLEKETSFFFLPLVDPNNKEQQLVVRLNDRTFKRLGIEFDSAKWVHLKFSPANNSTHSVTATLQQAGDFEFTDTSTPEKRYKWKGELKAEYAQRIAQTLATKLSRIAVDESEWLRRIAKS